MIGELLMEVTGQEARLDPKRFPNILLLGHMMRDAGRSHEAVEFLRTRTGSQAPKRIRELYRDIFLENLELAFPKDEQATTWSDSKRVFRFIDIFFDRLFKEDELRKLLSLEHPYYDMAPLRLERHGDALRINFPVVGIYPMIGTLPPPDENVADFVVDISIPLNDSRWKVEMIRADVDPNHRGRHIGAFVMDRIFSMLREMGIAELTTEGNEDGRYAWLRMGAEFANPSQQHIVEHEIRNHLKTQQGKALPTVRSRRLTASEISDFLSKVDKDDLQSFLQEHWFNSPHYRWDLNPDSTSMKRFKAYFENKRKAILQTGTLH